MKRMLILALIGVTLLISACDEVENALQEADPSLNSSIDLSVESTPEPAPTPEAEITRHYIWYDGNEVNLSGIGGSGRSAFILFVSKTGPQSEIEAISPFVSGSNYFKVEKIIRVWYADEKGVWDLRETECRKFPCIDESDHAFSSPLKIHPGLAVGDFFETQNNFIGTENDEPKMIGAFSNVTHEIGDLFRRFNFPYFNPS